MLYINYISIKNKRKRDLQVWKYCKFTVNDSIVHLQICQEVPAVSVGVMIDGPKWGGVLTSLNNVLQVKFSPNHSNSNNQLLNSDTSDNQGNMNTVHLTMLRNLSPTSFGVIMVWWLVSVAIVLWHFSLKATYKNMYRWNDTILGICYKIIQC